MELAERLGKTFEELMSSIGDGELNLWKGLQLLRQYECPNCGVEPKDMNKVQVLDVKCPVCGHKWDRIKRTF